MPRSRNSRAAAPPTSSRCLSASSRDALAGHGALFQYHDRFVVEAELFLDA
jgi:hypothetical protein